ncbi:Cytochrome P450 [Vigna unguiculata]|uniref:Cytochrome P450 n=1 Tax=Vigna unguiculata TaxID=3917 RepID=A0A4D6KNY3_VIGUN|nr:Cytochrome P450 [Vigna unguiculata]
MEFQPSLMMVIALLLSLLFWLARIYKQKIKAEKLPPGPWKLPLIGNLHQLAVAGTLPHHTLQNLSNKYGPLMHLQLGQISARPELLAPKILAYGSADIAFSPYGDYWRHMRKTAPYGDYWRHMRKICTLELLSAKRVQSFSFIREDEVNKLIESIQACACTGSPVNVSKSVSSSVSTIVTRAAFGKKSEHQERLLCLLKEGVELAGGLEKMHEEVDKILDNIISEHRSKHQKGEAEENLVDVLLRIQQSATLDTPVTMDNIKAIIWGDIFGAGSDTSGVVLEWSMSELLRNPRVMKKAQSEIREALKGKKRVSESEVQEVSYLKWVIKETLRLHPSAPLLLPRECREACMIGGYEIAVKTKVIVNAWAIGRDPKHWYDAEKFIPERFDGTDFDFKGNNFEYIPFGGGRRMCPGILLGLANIQLPLAALLYHFDWEIPNGIKPEKLDMAESFGASVGRKNNLYLLPTPFQYSLHHHLIVDTPS